MGKKTNIDVTASINRITGKRDQFQQIVRETQAFFDMVESNPAEVKVGNIKSVINNLQQVRDEYDKIHNDINSDHGQIEFASTLFEVLEKAEDKFGTIGVMFKNVTDNTDKYVTGLSNIMQHFNDSSFGVKFLDIGARFGDLQNQLKELFGTLKSIGNDTTLFGKFNLDFGSLDKYDLFDRIDVLRQMRDIAEELLNIDSSMSKKDFAGGMNVSDLTSAIRKSEEDLNELRELNLDTTEELRKRKEIIQQIQGETWENWEHEGAKNSIHDDDVYNEAINDIEKYIKRRQDAIAQLKSHENDLFAVDGISKYVNDAQAEIERLNALKIELQDLRVGKTNDAPVIGDVSGVVQQLEAIKNAVVEIKDAFKPLTDALANEDSALSKMVQSNVADLELLNSKVEETFKNIEALSKKDFNVSNFITESSGVDAEAQQLRDYQKVARELGKQVKSLYKEAGETYQIGGAALNRPYMQLLQNLASGELGSKGTSMRIEGFSFNAIIKEIGQAGSLGEVDGIIDRLNHLKTLLLEFNNLRNDIQPGSFIKSYKDIQKWDDTTKESVSNIRQVAEESEDVTKNIGEQNLDGLVEQIKTSSEQIKVELDTIRQLINATFDFSTIDPKLENIKSITENIYQQFAELQTKINALEFKLQLPEVINNPKSESDVINDAADAMKNEEKAASDAVPKKNAFTEANKKAADSAKDTKESAEGAAEGIKEESKSAKQAVQNLKDVSSKIGDKSKSVKLKGLSQEDFEEYASQIAADKGLTMGQVSVSMGQNDNMRVATVQMLNEELAQSVTYTYQLVELEDDVTEAYLTGYRAVGNTNKALRIAAAAQKKADAERLKAAKTQAKNNEWLIKQQSKLDTQERRYKHSKKSIDGSTQLMSTETSLEGVVDDADKTIDTLAKHIRDRIQSTIGGTLTDDLRKQILDDIRILQNEIAVAQNNKYSATNMKASNVETNKKAYTEYLNAFEANAKKANVFDVMEQSIINLRDELSKVSDSTGLDKFIDNLKVARNKLAAEKAKYEQESKENQQNEKIYNDALKAQEKLYDLKKKMVDLDPESSKGQETMRKLTEAQNEYNEALSKTNRQLLTIGQLQSIEDLEKQQKAELSTKHKEYQASVSAEQEAKDLKYILSLYKEYTDAEKSLKKMQSDPTGASHDDKMLAAVEAIKRAKESLKSIGIDVNNIVASELLTERQKLALLEEQIKYKKQIANIENTANDRATTKQNKQNQNYGKTIFNRESRYFDTISANERKLSSDVRLSDSFIATLEKYKSSFKELETLRAKFENDPDAFNNTELKESFQSTAIEVEGLRKEILSTFKEAQKFEHLSSSGAILGEAEIDSERFHDAKSAMIDFAASVTNGQFKLEGFNATGTEMYGTLDKGAGVVEKVTVALREGTNQLYAYQTSSKEASNSWDKLGSSLKNGVKQLIGMYFGFQEAIQAVRQGLTYVKEIDLAMTELKKVTDETDETYKNFLKTASSTASVIGSTVSDFTDATAAFARLGYSIDESAKMAETAIVYKNVADGLDTVEESTDSIISTMMAYGIAADDTMSIIDRFNAVGNNFAITSAGIGEAMQRSASALKEGGNTIDESIGLITGANAVIQDPLQVGTALKTLSLRIRGVKTELEDAGLETEGMAETTSQLQAKINALTHGKVDIMLNADEFKSTTQILREMAQAWEHMTDVEQAAALELLGGKRQANILSSLISNFETVEDVIETSMNSSGSAMEENAKWLDSIEGKTYQFTNAVETMWSNMLDSEVVKGVIDFGTKFIQFLDTAPGKITAVVAALAGIAKFKGFSLLGLGQDAIKDFNNIKTAYSTLSTLSQLNPVNASMSTASIQAYATAVSSLTPKIQANMLASQGLSKTQIQLAMQYNGLSDDVIREATAHVFAKQAQDQENVSGQQLLTNKILLSAASLKLKGDTDSLAAAEFLEANASKLAAAADKEQIIMNSNLSASAKAAALAAIGQTNANHGLLASIKALFASNPIGWIFMIVSGVVSLVSWVATLKKTNEELIKQATELKNAYKEESDVIQGNISTLQGLEEEFNKLSRGVDDYGNNISLATDDYERYREIVATIVGISPDLISGYDAEGNALANKNGLLQKSIELMQEEQRLKAKEYLSNDNIKTITEGALAGLEEDVKNLEVPNDIAYTSKILDDGSTKSGYVNRISDYIEQAIGVKFKHQGIDRYIQENLDLVEANIGAILNNASKDFTDSSGNTWKGLNPQQIESLETYIYSIIDATNEASDEVRSMLQLVPQTKKGYYELTDATQQFLNQYINGFNITKDTTSADIKEMQDKISAFTDFVIHNSDVESTIQVGFNLNAGKDADGNNLNISQYKQQVTDLKNKIQESAHTDEQKNTLLSMFGLDDDDVMKNDIEKAIQHVENILKGEADKLSTEAQTYLDNLSITEALHIKANISADLSGLSVDELKQKIHESYNFDVTNYTDAISAHSAAITEYQEALQKLGKGSFTMDDFMELIKKYPELAKGVDISSNAFHGLSRNLNGAIKTYTKNFIKQLKELRAGLVAAGKSTDSIDQLIEAIENMPEDALDGTIQKYSTLADKIDSARRAQDKLLSSMEENPNEGYETRGEAMEYMKEAMKKGEIGSESNLWNVAEKYGFTYDSAKSINENADALAKFIAIREQWFKTEDDGDDRTDDGYSYKGTESFIKDVESAVSNNAELQQYLTWDYDETTGTLNFDYNNEDWDTIISILSKTKELAGLTSDEFSDMMIQIGQYFGIDWGNYDDVLGHLNGIATSTSDAKTKVEEYGQAMQNYFGENTTVDLTTRPMVKFDSTNFKDWEKLYREIINNPDGHSEADIKNAQEQFEAIQRGDSYATVYSSTFSNDDGTKSVVVTPILPDGTVLSPEQLEEYANKLLAGEELEPDINIKLAEFDGKDSIKKAGEYAEALHKAQAEYDLLRDTLKINTTIDEKGISGLKEIKEIQSSLATKADGTVVIDEDTFREALIGAQYTEDQIDVIIDKIKKINKDAFNIDPLKIDETLINKGVAGLEEIEEIRDSLTKDEPTGLTIFDTDMFTSVMQESGYTKDKIDELIKKIQEYDNIISVSGNTDPLGLNNAGLSVDSLKASLNTLGITYKDTLGTWFDGKRDLTINVTDLVTTLKAKGWTDASIKEYVTKLSNNTNLDGFNVKVKGIENIDEVIKTANEVPEEKTTEYEVTGTGATTLDGIESQWTEVTKDKTTNYTINETTVKTTKDKTKFNLFNPSTWADGTANAQGTAFAGGSWGAPKTETALVGELGPEMLVRNGRWTTVGENGAEFTQVKKGDIIFNHRQTEELLKNGHVTGRGKAYASGTAYSVGSGTFARYEFSGSGGWQQYDVNDTVVESWGDLSGAISDASDEASDAKDKFEETFDWIEVRLEEINEQLDLMNAQLENANGYASKNSIIDQIMGVNTNKMENLIAGIKKYSDYTARLLANVPSQYREAAQDGAIAITEFVGEADEKTVEAIDKYRDWAQKVADLRQQLEETKKEIRDLAIQKIDNAEHSGAVRATVEDSQTEKLQNAADYDSERGLITDPNYYAAMMENSNVKRKWLINSRNEMQKLFDEAVENGQLTPWTDDWYEELDKLYQIDAEIDEATKELEEFQNAINDIYWENFDQLINRLDYISEETQGFIDLMDSADMVSKPDNEDGWGASDVEWTKEGLATLGLHAQEMERAEERAKAYAVAIDDLTAEYEAGHYSESEYYEKLNELTQGQYEAIEAAQEEKEAIVELNEQRVEAIKEGIEKEIKAYEKLIDAKKEELSAEKDLYDFQKSTMEQQKNIADIERKLAALANDNSMSAAAKRKQLEAELAEAQYELQDSYYNRSVEDKQTALDKELEDFQTEKEAEIEKWEEYLTNVEAIVAESLGVVQTKADEIGATLTEKANEYNLTVSDAVLNPWKDGSIAIDEYTTKFGDTVSSTTEQLETIRAKWQEIKEELQEANKEADKYYNKDKATADGPSVADINAENADYIDAKPKQNTGSTPPSNAPETQEKSIVIGGKINASGAKIYQWAGGQGYNQYFSSDPVYTVLGEENGYLKVRHHKSSSGVTGWFKKSDVKAYAKGTTGANKSQLALLDELGEELVFAAGPNGRLQYITKGTSVIPHDISENLMELGKLDPSDVLKRSTPQIGMSPSVVNNEVNITMEIAEVVHIDHVDHDTLPDLTKAVRKEMDSYMTKLNNAIKSKVR